MFIQIKYKGYLDAINKDIVLRCLERLYWENVPDYLSVHIQFFSSSIPSYSSNIINRVCFSLMDNDDMHYHSAAHDIDGVNINEMRLTIKNQILELCPDLTLK